MSDFLYPFIEGDEQDAGPLLLDLARSAEAKAAGSLALRSATLDRLDTELDVTATAMAAPTLKPE